MFPPPVFTLPESSRCVLSLAPTVSQTLIGFGHVIPFFVLLIPLVRPNLALFGVEWTRASSFHFGSRASKLARVVCVLARTFLYIMEELDPALFTEGGFARDAYQPLLLGGLDVVAASTPVGHHILSFPLFSLSFSIFFYLFSRQQRNRKGSGGQRWWL